MDYQRTLDPALHISECGTTMQNKNDVVDLFMEVVTETVISLTRPKDAKVSVEIIKVRQSM